MSSIMRASSLASEGLWLRHRLSFLSRGCARGRTVMWGWSLLRNRGPDAQTRSEGYPVPPMAAAGSRIDSNVGARGDPLNRERSKTDRRSTVGRLEGSTHSLDSLSMYSRVRARSCGRPTQPCWAPRPEPGDQRGSSRAPAIVAAPSVPSPSTKRPWRSRSLLS